MKNYFVLFFTFIFLTTCSSQKRNKINQKSLDAMRKASIVLDSVFVLKSFEDTAKYKKAINLLDTAIIFDSLNYKAYWKKSELFCILKLYDKALKPIVQYCSINKSNYDFELRKGYLYEKMGDLEKAKTIYSSVLDEINLKMENDNNKNIIIKKMILLCLIDYPKALSYHREMLLKHSNDNLIVFFNEYIVNFSRDEFIDYQLEGKEQDVFIP